MKSSYSEKTEKDRETKKETAGDAHRLTHKQRETDSNGGMQRDTETRT